MNQPALAPGVGLGWSRLAEEVARLLPREEIDAVWAFPNIRRDGREWGTAVIARVEGGRRRIFTARYQLVLKGKERGQFEAAVEDIATNFRPDLIMISAGFDAHLTDPLGQLKLEDRDYVSMTRTIKQWAAEVCQGRVVSCLEGGYNLDTLGETVRSHVKELASN